MTFLRLFCGFLLQVIPFSCLSFAPYSDNLRFEKKKAYLFTLGLLIGLAAVFAGAGCYLQRILPSNQILFNAVNVVFFVALIPCLLWYLFAVRVIWQKKLFVFSFALMSALGITSFGNIISTNFLHDESDGLPYEGRSLLVLFVMTAVFLPILLWVIKHYYQPVEASISPKESLHLCLISLFLFVILGSGLTFINYSNMYNPMSLFLYFALLVTVFLVYTSFFELIAASHEKLKAQQDADHTRYLMKLQEEQYLRINFAIQTNRRMQHDLRHHLVTIQGLLQGDEPEKAKEYVENCMDSMAEFESVKISDNKVIDAVVSHFKYLADKRGIEFIVRIDLPSKISITDSDISILLGNMLENAVDAAEFAEPDNRTIRLNIIYSGKMLAVTVDNGFNGTVNMDGERYLSTKLEHSGIGLQSIEGIAEKYNGGVEFSHSDKEFHSSVMLSME